MKILLAFLLGIFCVLEVSTVFGNSEHHSIIDVYGTTKISAEDINNIENKFNLLTNIFFLKNNISDSKNAKKGGKAFDEIKNELNRMGEFSYLNISPIVYPDNNNIYYTIDVIEKGDLHRLNIFSPKPKKSFHDPDKLIAIWREYEKEVMTDFFRNKTHNDNFSCQVYHCLEGELLKKYNPIFTNLVPKNKEILETILKNDNDEKKRAAAAFLLAYISDGKELIKVLIPVMKDSSPLVRNNAMRVLSYALSDKLKNADFPVQKAIEAMDYPTALDRNKASMIVLGLASQPRYKAYIKEHAKSQLLNFLHMLQPNVHDTAYYILKEISGLKFGERDYQSWENWLNTTII